MGQSRSSRGDTHSSRTYRTNLFVGEWKYCVCCSADGYLWNSGYILCRLPVSIRRINTLNFSVTFLCSQAQNRRSDRCSVVSARKEEVNSGVLNALHLYAKGCVSENTTQTVKLWCHIKTISFGDGFFVTLCCCIFAVWLIFFHPENWRKDMSVLVSIAIALSKNNETPPQQPKFSLPVHFRKKYKIVQKNTKMAEVWQSLFCIPGICRGKVMQQIFSPPRGLVKK